MPIFFTEKSCNRGGGTTPPQMPLTVNSWPLRMEALPWPSRTITFCQNMRYINSVSSVCIFAP